MSDQLACCIAICKALMLYAQVIQVVFQIFRLIFSYLQHIIMTQSKIYQKRFNIMQTNGTWQPKLTNKQIACTYSTIKKFFIRIAYIYLYEF